MISRQSAKDTHHAQVKAATRYRLCDVYRDYEAFFKVMASLTRKSAHCGAIFFLQLLGGKLDRFLFVPVTIEIEYGVC